MTYHDLDEALERADPARHLDCAGPAVADALDTIRRGIVETELVVPSRPRRNRVAIAIAAAILGTATLAAATGVLTRTGIAAGGGEAGSGELLRLDADDAPEVLVELGADIPLPPGGSFDEIIADLPDEPTDQAEEGVRFTLEFNAACQWAGYWLEANEADDAEAMAEALTALDAVPEREALIANSSPPDALVRLWARIADAARSGDPEAMYNAGYGANCSGVAPGE